MIQLRRSQVVADREDIERWKVEFREKHCVLLPRLLEPPLLDFLLERLEQGEWRDRVHEGIGIEVVLEDLPARGLLHFVANAPAFLRTVQEITGCGPLTQFEGRVYRFIPNSGHHDSWHDDNGKGRLVAMSLNLSPRGYEGGVFQLREWSSKRVLAEIANTGWGDATLFRISRQLEHQVTEVTGEKSKTAFAGWFKSGDPNPFAGVAGRRFELHSPSL
jgi:2-oxoglutarate-Fe(II)-dependent oxygenase superfamily protein